MVMILFELSEKLPGRRGNGLSLLLTSHLNWKRDRGLGIGAPVFHALLDGIAAGISVPSVAPRPFKLYCAEQNFMT